jgi:hypothetical protein
MIPTVVVLLGEENDHRKRKAEHEGRKYSLKVRPLLSVCFAPFVFCFGFLQEIGIGFAREQRHGSDHRNYPSADGVVSVSGQAACPDSGATYDRARLSAGRYERPPRRCLRRDLR